MNNYWENLEQCAGAGYFGFWLAVALLVIGTFVFGIWLVDAIATAIGRTEWCRKWRQARWDKPRKYHPKWEGFKQITTDILFKVWIGLLGLLALTIGLYIIYGTYTTIACMIEMQ